MITPNQRELILNATACAAVASAPAAGYVAFGLKAPWWLVTTTLAVVLLIAWRLVWVWDDSADDVEYWHRERMARIERNRAGLSARYGPDYADHFNADHFNTDDIDEDDDAKRCLGSEPPPPCTTRH